jgi:transcriptional regulator with XRE-family HTH domain
MPPPLAFGTLLRRYRLAAGFTQEELAERAGLSARAISELERGTKHRPRRDTVQLLVEALALASSDRVALETARHAGAAGGSVHRHDTLSPPLVGRSQELALVERHLGGSPDGLLPPILLLTGEPGIGKTRLLREAAVCARRWGWNVLQGGCQRRGGQEPYAPLLQAVARHLHGLQQGRQRAALAGCAWLVRLLPELAGGPIEPLPPWTVPPEHERRLMFDAVVRFLTNVAEQAPHALDGQHGVSGGTLLVLDDLQWAGADALDLLAALAHSAAEARLRVIGAYRDTEVEARHPLTALLADLAQAGLATQRPLAPLAAGEAAQLLDALLDGN